MAVTSNENTAAYLYSKKSVCKVNVIDILVRATAIFGQPRQLSHHERGQLWEFPNPLIILDVVVNITKKSNE